MHRRRATAAALMVLVIMATALPQSGSEAADQAHAYWGAWISGPGEGATLATAPWDTQAWDAFEADAGKSVSILHWGQPWYQSTQWPHGYYPFVPRIMDAVRARGAIPMIDWGSWDPAGSAVQPAFALRNIARGATYSFGGQTFDHYVTAWARAAKAWGHPFFLRFDWEMNGNWQFPWSAQLNGNTAADYVAAWRHVHDIFTAIGATNVSWVWCPNVSGPTTVPMSRLYPGDRYVDWTCLDGYDRAGPARQSFGQLFGGSPANGYRDSYGEITALAPDKPLMLGEWAADELGDGGAYKAVWITDALRVQIPRRFPHIRAVVWFNWNADPGSSYAIESSPPSQRAFAAAIASPYYASNAYSNLDDSPIPPPSG